MSDARLFRYKTRRVKNLWELKRGKLSQQKYMWANTGIVKRGEVIHRYIGKLEVCAVRSKAKWEWGVCCPLDRKMRRAGVHPYKIKAYRFGQR